jgi:hypothetical protein
MPKTIGAADLAAIYEDPDRARAEAERDLSRARKWEASIAEASAHGLFMVGDPVRAGQAEQNAIFKLKRAKAAQQLRAVGTTPIFAGFAPGQLKVFIVVGVGVAAVLFLA